jgi:hypothetical protein
VSKSPISMAPNCASTLQKNLAGQSPVARKTSSRSPSHRTYDGSLNWSPDHTTTNTLRCACSVTAAGARPQRQSRLPMEQARAC